MNAPSNSLPFKVVESLTGGGATLEILEYEPLAGGESLATVEQIYNLNRAEARPRQLRHEVESFSARVAGGEGRYQTQVSGTGIVIFKPPVPPSEILEIALDNETLQVDGSFALLRTGGTRFTVEKAASSIVGALTGGEG
jgi:hypothetical protein